MFRALFHVSGFSLLSLATAWGTGATAQTAVDELVVTAQKRDESRLDVPIALASITQGDLERQGVQDMRDVAALTPGLVVQSQSAANSGYVMRGVTTDDGAATAEPRVAVFQDGVSIAKQRGAFVELFDLARVEIARGPQPTLFGRGALTGAVHFIQNKPQLGELDSRLRLEVGDQDYRAAEGMLNAPLADSAALRVAFRMRQRDGAIENLLGGPDLNSLRTGAFRVSLGWRPSESLRNDLIFNYQLDRPDGQATKSRTFFPTDPATGEVLGDLSNFTGAALSTPQGFEGGRPLGLRRAIAGATWLATLEPQAGWSLSQIAAWRRFRSQEVYDLDGFSFPLLGTIDASRYEQLSYELRLNIDQSHWRGFIGASVFAEDGQQSSRVQVDEPVLLNLLTNRLDRTKPDPGPLATYRSTSAAAALLRGMASAAGFSLPAAQANAIASNLLVNHTEGGANGIEATTYDLFGDLSFDVSERLTLSAGVRWSAAERATEFQSFAGQRSVLAGFLGALRLADPARSGLLAALSAPSAPDLPQSTAYPIPRFGLAFQPSALETDESRDTGVTWRLSASYHMDSGTRLYATYARGRRPEVVSPLSPSSPGGPVRFVRVSPETLDSWEVGAKGQTRHLRVEGALYGYRYDHFQTTVQEGTQFFTDDAGEARAYGAELQTLWRPLDWADLSLAYSYSRARFQNGLYRNNRLRLSPDHTLSLQASIRRSTSAGEWEFNPLWTWRSKAYFNDDNDDPELQVGALVPVLQRDKVQRAFGLLDARVKWTPSSRAWPAEIFARNLLDRRYLKDAGNSGDEFGLPTYVPGEPRLIGLAFTWSP